MWLLSIGQKCCWAQRDAKHWEYVKETTSSHTHTLTLPSHTLKSRTQFTRVSVQFTFLMECKQLFDINFQIRFHFDCKIMIFFSFDAFMFSVHVLISRFNIRIYVFHSRYLNLSVCLSHNLHTSRDLLIENYCNGLCCLSVTVFYMFHLFVVQTWRKKSFFSVFIWESLVHVIECTNDMSTLFMWYQFQRVIYTWFNGDMAVTVHSPLSTVQCAILKTVSLLFAS